MKIIPAIDIMGGQVVRLYKGDPQQKTVYFDDPVAVAKQWESEGADMLHLVDLDATLSRGSNINHIKKIIDNVTIPVEVAGGLRSVSSAKIMNDTADKIVIGTMAFMNRQNLDELAADIGKDKIIISVDHKNGEIVSHGWQSGTGVPLLDAIRDFVSSGYKEFLLTDTSKDGTMEGPDLDFLSKACQISDNVIASGGISNLDDVYKVKEKNAAGVILGKALYEGKISIGEAKI